MSEAANPFAPSPSSGPPARSILVVLGGGLLTTFLTLVLSVLASAGASGDRAAWNAVLEGSKGVPGGNKPDKLEARIALRLHACPGCNAGFVRATLMTGHGRDVQQQVMLNQGVPEAMVRELRAG